MLLGAHFAGAAIENSMLGATHALANPLSAHFGLIHGVAIGLMLPHVIRYNAQAPDAALEYRRLAQEGGICSARDPDAIEKLIQRVQQFCQLADLPATLAECGVNPARLPQLAQEAAQQWTGQFNPRPVGAAELEELYRAAL